jgi:quinoprotein glucose dehydrogenase
VQLPGNAGGANWNGAAFDATTGMLYVPSVTNPFLVKLEAPDATRSNFLLRRGLTDLPTLDGLALVKPPYGRVTTYDLNAGTIVWQVPVGNGPRDHALLKDLKLPPLGGGRSFPLLTPSVLFVGHRGNPRYNESPTLRALDKRTGEQIASLELPLGPSTPSTYLYQGRQYIVMAAGVGAEAQVIAVALPSTTTAQ